MPPLTYRGGLPRNLTADEADDNLRNLDERLADLAARLAALEAAAAARVSGAPPAS